jgi:hypothetical protein
MLPLLAIFHTHQSKRAAEQGHIFGLPFSSQHWNWMF